MGIYPEYKLTPTATGYTEEVREPGVVRRRTLTAGKWTEERTDCFCCSCDPTLSTHDPNCRNHGWWGRRPCDLHGMPGSVTEDGEMPASVQECRRRREAKSNG